jgi:serine protease AprX
LTGADGYLNYISNGITLTGADGITLTGADGITLTGADGSTYTGTNGITLTGADGITLTGADGITLTGADGITLTGADGTTYQADSFLVRRPNGITLTGADGITLTGADGYAQTGTNGITLTGADGITLTGADGITLTGADSIIGVKTNGVLFTLTQPTGITLTGADGITLTGADGITLTGADGITLTGADSIESQNNPANGLQSVDPELAITLGNATDDSNINAVIVFHYSPTETDLVELRQIGITGGTRFRILPMIAVSATRQQLIAVSRLSQVRSLYGNRTLTLNSDPFFKPTGIQRVGIDQDLQTKNGGTPVSGRNITVAVLDTGISSQHNDLNGRVVQNVRLVDSMSAPLGFVYPTPIENVINTDVISGHGTFVSGVIAASGILSSGKYSGVAPGANVLGLSAGDLNLSQILDGFDYLLEKGANYNVRVVNCSFSSNTVYDDNDPVNIATKMLVQNGINVVFSAGNSGAGNGTLNPYAVAPWVVSVGATDDKSKLASFSSRGIFGSQYQHPSLVAPGVNVASLRAPVSETSVFGVVTSADTQRLTPNEIPFYTTASGTSFSAPQVAGAIALMLQTNPNLTPAEVKDILQRTATPMPAYYYHEVGAGMLNTHAAVLEAAFPQRKMGIFRSILSKNQVRFITGTTQTFSQSVLTNSSLIKNFALPSDTIQAGFHIAWGFSANDFGLKLYDAGGTLKGESNYLNLPGLTGRREKVILNNPDSQSFQAIIQHTGNIGTTQTIFGAVETTRVEYPQLSDLQTLSPQMQAIVKESLRSFVMLPEGRKFRPESTVSRTELAETLVRGGGVPQYVAGSPLYTDVKDITTRSVVESVQSNPSGKLFSDASVGSAFYPNDSATKLITAIALVKAANLESLTTVSNLPLSVTDASSIPAQWRGYVAVALQKGLITIDGNKFNPNRALTRIELALAMVNLTHLAAQ